jgi:hypothetical protein
MVPSCKVWLGSSSLYIDSYIQKKKKKKGLVSRECFINIIHLTFGPIEPSDTRFLLLIALQPVSGTRFAVKAFLFFELIGQPIPFCVVYILKLI